MTVASPFSNTEFTIEINNYKFVFLLIDKWWVKRDTFSPLLLNWILIPGARLFPDELEELEKYLIEYKLALDAFFKYSFLA